MVETQGDGTAKSLYNKLESLRDPYLERAEKCAKLTIPTLIPPKENNAHTIYPTPYQGLGARGTNNLASKLLLALLPPNSPFFKLTVDDFTLEQLTQQEGMRAEVEEGFNKMERAVMSDVESSAIRVSTFEVLKHLIVGGNVLVNILNENGLRIFPLSRFVVKRDPAGTVLEMITKEGISTLALSESVKQACGVDDTENNREDVIELYTRIYLSGESYNIYQEINGIVIPDSTGHYPKDKCPWMALRWTKIDNEDYGRGFIEEYFGDLYSLEKLTKAIVQGSAAAAKVLFLVAPNGSTSAKTLDEAPNGSIREGNATDVTTIQMEKFADFKIAFETIKEITSRLSFAFLLNTSVQRKGERVTAEEIRYMAGELEDALGGVYSILSQEFQLPLVKLLIHKLQKQKKLPKLPEGVVKPQITTGLEALGRGHDLNKLRVLADQLAPFGPAVLSTYMNVGDYIKRAGTALGIDMGGLIKTPEEITQAEQRMQMQSMIEKLGPNVINQLGAAAGSQGGSEQ